MSAELPRNLLGMPPEDIISKIFAKETGALRMQQVGLFTLIYVLQGGEEPVTASRIAARTGQTNGQVHRQLQKLLKLNLVERTQVRNRQGRGHAFVLSVKDNPQTRRVAKAIAEAAVARSRRRGG